MTDLSTKRSHESVTLWEMDLGCCWVQRSHGWNLEEGHAKRLCYNRKYVMKEFARPLEEIVKELPAERRAEVRDFEIRKEITC